MYSLKYFFEIEIIQQQLFLRTSPLRSCLPGKSRDDDKVVVKRPPQGPPVCEVSSEEIIKQILEESSVDSFGRDSLIWRDVLPQIFFRNRVHPTTEPEVLNEGGAVASQDQGGAVAIHEAENAAEASPEESQGDMVPAVNQVEVGEQGGAVATAEASGESATASPAESRRNKKSSFRNPDSEKPKRSVRWAESVKSLLPVTKKEEAKEPEQDVVLEDVTPEELGLEN